MGSPTLNQHILRLHPLTLIDTSLPEVDRQHACNDALRHLLSVTAPEPAEAVAAARLVAAHLIAMEAFRRAMLTDASPDASTRLQMLAARMTTVTIAYHDLLRQADGRTSWLDQILAGAPIRVGEGRGAFRQQDRRPGENAMSEGADILPNPLSANDEPGASRPCQRHPMPGEDVACPDPHLGPWRTDGPDPAHLGHTASSRQQHPCPVRTWPSAGQWDRRGPTGTITACPHTTPRTFSAQ